MCIRELLNVHSNEIEANISVDVRKTNHLKGDIIKHKEHLTYLILVRRFFPTSRWWPHGTDCKRYPELARSVGKLQIDWWPNDGAPRWHLTKDVAHQGDNTRRFGVPVKRNLPPTFRNLGLLAAYVCLRLLRLPSGGNLYYPISSFELIFSLNTHTRFLPLPLSKAL